VVLDSGGTFLAALQPRPHGPGGDDGWWQAVMNDWRTPRQTRHHFDRLGEHLGVSIVVACDECILRREFQTAELLAIYGPDYRMVYLRYDIAECPARKSFTECEVRYPRT
jgi:hypothetical protein